MVDTLKLVENKVKELGSLYERMDDTRSLLLDDYELTDFNGFAIPNVVDVTLNTPGWQATVLSDKLLKLRWQPVVKSSMDKFPASQIKRLETLSGDIWAQVDEFLLDKYGSSGGLGGWLSRHVIGRSLIGARWWVYYDQEKRLVIDCLPVDMRWCPYELNEWYCHITRRSDSEIEKEYKIKLKEKGDEIEVLDFWDKDKEEIWVGKEKVKERENPFGVPPFVVVLPAAGFMFRDAGYMKYEAEDALFLDRGLYKEANRIASIAQSLAMETILPALVQESDDKSKPPDIPPAPGEGSRVKREEMFQRLPRGDLNNAFLKSSQVIEQAINRGGVTDTEAGSNQLDRTALWITTQNSLLIEKLQPRIDALIAFRVKSMRMILDQLAKRSNGSAGLTKKGETKIGIRGMERRYSGLPDPSTYRIDYKAFPRSKEQDIANTAQANAQKGLVPQRFILEETLQVEDPHGLLRELELEKWQEADPSIGMMDGALKYIEEAEELEGIDAQAKLEMSRNLTEMGVLLRRQRRQMSQPLPESARMPQEEKAKPNLQGLAALGAGAVRTGVERQEMLRARGLSRTELRGNGNE